MARKVNPELDAARARARELEKKAQAKIRRSWKNHHVELRGTKYDPTSGASVDVLNARQLAARIQRLETFNSRKTQFYGDALRRPMSSDAVREWQKTKRQYNYASRKMYEPFKNIRLPEGKTVDTRHQMLAMRKFATKRNYDAVIDIASPLRLQPHSFGSEKALREYTKSKQEQIKDLRGNRLREARQQCEEMIKYSNRNDVRDKIEKLTDDQFELLWFHSNFAETLARVYADTMETVSNPNHYDAENAALHVGQANELASWASRKKVKR